MMYSPADWNLMIQILDAVKSAIPDAANRPAGEVLEFVLGEGHRRFRMKALVDEAKMVLEPYNLDGG
jgi:hypothetical protein